MKINLMGLLSTQSEVNEVVVDRLGRTPNVEEFIIAFNVEVFEYFNAVGTWKWWKHNHVVNREKVLDELADCFAFFLSIILRSEEVGAVGVKGQEAYLMFEKDVQNVFDNLHKLKEEQDSIKVVNDLITIVSTDNETEEATSSIHRFAISLFIATLLFEGITWEELVAAYIKKSEVNIQRQVDNY